MYAIVDISGKQFLVEPGAEIDVPHQDADPGKTVTLDSVLLLNNGKKVEVGKPSVKNSTVKATVIEHGRTSKIPVFKKKRRKGYKVKNTHRQEFTRIRIDTIKETRTSPTKPASPKKKSTPKKPASPPKKKD